MKSDLWVKFYLAALARIPYGRHSLSPTASAAASADDALAEYEKRFPPPANGPYG